MRYTDHTKIHSR